MKRLLLISNSTLHGSGYLDHCEKNIKEFLGKAIKKVLFIPYARPSGISHDEYTELAAKRYALMGYELESVHKAANPVKAIENADAFFTGGGNTFVLINALHRNGLIEPIRNKVLHGTPYIGTSAGSNAACPYLKTTNDMPVIQPPSFEALNVFPYQINPHYLDPDPDSTHKGETSETRIREFLVFNDIPVIGLREGSMVEVTGDKYMLKGTTGARIFENENEPVEINPGDLISI